MIFVRGATRAYPSEVWEKAAIGVEDEFGNPFEVIELMWNTNRLHMMGAYGKTRGFDDAEIIVDNRRPEGVRIKYRQKIGGVTWLRRFGNSGPFIGKVARTPRNMRKLASHFEDHLWTIRDPHIRREVEAASKQLWEKMGTEEREFHEARIAAMNTHHMEKDIKLEDTSTLAAKQAMSLEKQEIQQRRMELDRREADLDKREDNITEQKAQAIREGGASTRYHKPYLMGLKLVELRKLARRDFKIQVAENWKKETIAEKILEAQEVMFQVKEPEPKTPPVAPEEPDPVPAPEPPQETEESVVS